MKKSKIKKKLKFVYETVPLSGSFMITSILGFVIVTVYAMSGRIDKTWAVTLDLIFVIMFVASLLSITPVFPKKSDSKK